MGRIFHDKLIILFIIIYAIKYNIIYYFEFSSKGAREEKERERRARTPPPTSRLSITARRETRDVHYRDAGGESPDSIQYFFSVFTSSKTKQKDKKRNRKFAC